MDTNTDDFPTFGLTLPADPGVSLTGNVIHDRYELLEEIGQGGFGCVFLARQKTPDRLVAVKVSRHDAALADRMVREANVLATLDHPAIARVYDAGTWDSPIGRRVYLVMELVPGAERFNTYCLNRFSRLQDRVRLFIRVCEAVGIAHDRSIVHRDLKPGNVLVSASGEPKVIDFGIAKVLGSGSNDACADSRSETAGDVPDDGTKTGMFMGTPRYAAPEQMAGEPVTPRSDVYALGKMLEDAFSDRQGRFPTGLRHIVDLCTRDNQGERYASASQLASALDRWLSRRSMATRLSATSAAIVAGLALWLAIRPSTIVDPPPPDPPPINVAPRPLRPIGELDEIVAVAAASDSKGRWFVVAPRPDEILIASQSTPHVVTARPRLDSPGVGSLAFDAKGDHLAAKVGAQCRVWTMDDLERNSNGTRLMLPGSAAADTSACIELSADGATLFAQTGDTEVVALDVKDGRPIDTVSLSDPSDAHITALCRGPDRTTVFLGLSNGTVARWTAGHGVVTRLDETHGPGPTLLASSPKGDRLASLGTDGRLCVRSVSGTTKASLAIGAIPLAVACADNARVLVATKSANDDASLVTEYGIHEMPDGNRLVVTGTAAVPEPILHLTVGGASFLAVTLDRRGESITEVWSPTPGSPVVERTIGFTGPGQDSP